MKFTEVVGRHTIHQGIQHCIDSSLIESNELFVQ